MFSLRFCIPRRKQKRLITRRRKDKKEIRDRRIRGPQRALANGPGPAYGSTREPDPSRVLGRSRVPMRGRAFSSQSTLGSPQVWAASRVSLGSRLAVRLGSTGARCHDHGYPWSASDMRGPRSRALDPKSEARTRAGTRLPYLAEPLPPAAGTGSPVAGHAHAPPLARVGRHPAVVGSWGSGPPPPGALASRRRRRPAGDPRPRLADPPTSQVIEVPAPWGSKCLLGLMRSSYLKSASVDHPSQAREA